jgi:hypothetical protein
MRAIYDFENHNRGFNALAAEIKSNTSGASFYNTIEISRAFKCKLSKFPSIKIRETRHVPANAGSTQIETQHGAKSMSDKRFDGDRG